MFPIPHQSKTDLGIRQNMSPIVNIFAYMIEPKKVEKICFMEGLLSAGLTGHSHSSQMVSPQKVLYKQYFFNTIMFYYDMSTKYQKLATYFASYISF